jgi:hypothetical protein
MSDFMDKQKVEFDDFVDKWEKALEQGLFKDAELPVVNPQTSDDSFFGFSNKNPTNSLSLSDNEYWSAINSAADDHDPKVINESKVVGTGNDSAYLKYVFSKEEIEAMSADAKKDAARAIALARNEDKVEFQGFLSRAQKQKITAYLHKIVDTKTGKLKESLDHKSTPTNPISKDSMGTDQEMTPQTLGSTYSNEELEQLSELKKQLYDLESKLMTSLGFGDNKNQKKIETKIESVKKEISKISDEMGRPYKNSDQPKHLENL